MMFREPATRLIKVETKRSIAKETIRQVEIDVLVANSDLNPEADEFKPQSASSTSLASTHNYLGAPKEHID